jgi:flagellar biosynthetic protein FlhB
VSENDKESKTEEATDKRIRDAVEKGNIPFSREAATFSSLAGIFVVAGFFLSGSVQNLNLSMARLLENPAGWRLENGADAIQIFTSIVPDIAGLLIPVIVLLALAGIAASVLQNAPSLVVDRIYPKLERVSLGKGWKRIFGSHGQVEFLKSLFKFVAVSVVAFLSLQAVQFDVLNSMFMEPAAIPLLTMTLAKRLLLSIIFATVVLVAADIVWSRVFWHRELRMTRQEVKDEMKQADGDPIVKARLRSLARDRQRKRMMGAVPRATVVIANPTHYAVALRYMRSEGGAPLVLAKGKDLVALRIRQIAEEHGIPVVEDKPLARALHDAVEIDKFIPPEFYKAVAAIIHFLLARGGAVRSLKSG